MEPPRGNHPGGNHPGHSYVNWAMQKASASSSGVEGRGGAVRVFSGDRLKAVLSMETLPTHLRCSWTWLVVIKIIFLGTILKISFRTKTTVGLCSGCYVCSASYFIFEGSSFPEIPRSFQEDLQQASTRKTSKLSH